MDQPPELGRKQHSYQIRPGFRRVWQYMNRPVRERDLSLRRIQQRYYLQTNRPYGYGDTVFH